MIKQFLFPIAIIVGGFILAAAIIASGPKLEQKPPPTNAPIVRTWDAVSETVQMTTITHGTVLPRTESDLIPEVSGRIVAISPAMVSGGFFSQGDVLFEIDALDYEVALEQARAGLASARSELNNAKKAHVRQLDLAKRQSASESQQDDALNRLQFAEASIREAKARLSRAERDMARTKITAPYDGRVRMERVDVGQFVNRGSAVADIYAIDVAEVRLPIHDEELAHLELPLNKQSAETLNFPTATLRARFAGQEHSWQGKVVRTEGELDPQTRMINVIVQVDSPYQQSNNRPPLAVGLFVEAEIVGKQVEDIFILPRSAIQNNAQIYVIDSDSQLQFRDVTILRTVDEQVYITSGFQSGETICLSTVNNAVEGMKVRPFSEKKQTEGLAES